MFEPYHARIRTLLDQRQTAGRRTVFVAMHSFTPVFKGESRAMQVGVLYNRDARLANHAFAAAPVWLWAADASRVLWANAAGAALLGAANPHALTERRLSAAHPLASAGQCRP